ncbi:hypothetical protein GWO43_15250 [candidate division KSB1 bacterium]|nr:hypothetical protein [candidate division KSB1 bacterium]NIT72202.1 hypothetical protein [candidate division KSB1 bacterium]NIV71161.1 hypothetical protein [Phycisphaerae bacterium]NIX71882.1 hypothetical protein [candidate division KSB1 bacterium]
MRNATRKIGLVNSIARARTRRWNGRRRKESDEKISIGLNFEVASSGRNWNPTGISKGFYFRIGITTSHLQDVKPELPGGATTVFSALSFIAKLHLPK